MWILILISSALFMASMIEVKRGGTSYFAHYVILSLILTYSVVPILNYYYDFGRHKYFISYLNDASSVLHASLLVAVYAFSFFLGLKISSRNHGFYVWFSERAEKRSYVWAIFAVSVISFSLYVYFTGRGLQYVFANASGLRSGVDDAKSYAAAFMKVWTYYIEFVVFYFFAKYSYVGRSSKIPLLSVFVVMLLLATLKSFADGGRGGLINLIVGLIFVAAVSGRFVALPKFKILLGACTAVFIGVYGKIYLFQLFRNDGLQFSDVNEVAILSQVITEYSHQFSSLVMAVNQGLGFERLYIDFVVWVFKPLKLMGVAAPDSISYFNTYYATGVWDSEIPPGAIAFNYYEGGGVGVFVGGLLSGYIVKFVDKLILNTVRQGNMPFANAFSAVVFIYTPFLFLNSDPALFLQWVMAYVTLFFIIAILGGLRLKRLRGQR